MDVRYVNPFVKSICNTFEMMVGTSVAMGKPSLKNSEGPCSDVSSIIGFSGDASGSVVLNFDLETAGKIATAFAGVEMDQNHPDFADALGELANMVAGGAKAQFEGLNISISLPSVIVGPNHCVSTSQNAPQIVIPCKTDVGEFLVEIGMVVVKKPERIAQPQAVGAIS